MADPTQLQGQIFQTFGQGLTGIDYNSISSGIEKDRDFKRKELDSLYDVGAELDANAFRALQGELGGIYDKIESNDLIAGTPEFRAAQRRLTSIATDLKQTQDLTQSVLRDASSNPQNVSYIVEDEEGNPIDLGYSGLIDAARSFGGEKFGRPEDYLGAGSQFLSKIGERIDENDLRRSVQQSVEADVKRAFEEIGLDGSELDTKMDNYRSGLVDLRKELGEESFNAIRDNNKQRYQEGIRSKYAIDKNRNAVEKGKNVDDYATEYVEGFIPRAKSDVSRVTTPNGGGGKGMIRLEDVTVAARNASDTLDPTQLEQYIKPSEREVSYSPTTNEFAFFSIDENSKGEIVRKDIVTISADDPEAISRYLIRLNQKEIDRESLDAFEVPAGNQDLAAQSREAAQAPIKAANDFVDEALAVSSISGRDKVKAELEKLGFSNINFSGTMLNRKSGIEEVNVEIDGETKTLDLTTSEGQDEFRKTVVKKRKDLNSSLGKKKLPGT